MSKDTSGRSKLNLGREAMTTERDCKHGQLARSCNVCELEAEVARQAAEIERLTKAKDAAVELWSATGKELEAANALLRRAHQVIDSVIRGDWDGDDGLCDAIKQHLGEQT